MSLALPLTHTHSLLGTTHTHNTHTYTYIHTYTECISAEDSGEYNEVEIPDYTIDNSTTSDFDDSNTIDAAEADEVGNDVNAEEEEEYPKLYFVPDNRELIVIIGLKI